MDKNNEQPYKLSYESDGKMGKDHNAADTDKAKDIPADQFFNSTQSSE